MVLVVVMAIGFIFDLTVRAAEPKVTNKGLGEILDKYSIKSVIVKSGDTFWVVQEREGLNEDTRTLKYYAEFINNKSMGNLQVNEKIFIFCEKTE
jgi:hypothetical protein